MNKIAKKILIFVMVFTIVSPTVIRPREVYSASAGVVTLEAILMYLISLATQKNEVNIPIPKTREQKEALYDAILNIVIMKPRLLGKGWKNINDNTLIDYVFDSGEIDINPAEYVNNNSTFNIDNHLLNEVTKVLEDYYKVPSLQNTKPTNSDSAHRINIKSKLEKDNIYIDDIYFQFLEENNIFKYPYITVMREFDNANFGYVFSSNQPFYIYINNDGSSVASLYMAPQLQNPATSLKIATFSKYNGNWLGSNKINDLDRYNSYDGLTAAAKLSNILKTNIKYINLNKQVYYTTFNLYYKLPQYKSPTYYLTEYDGNILEGQMSENSLSYKTFLQSKYAGGSIGLKENEEIIINIDNWLVEDDVYPIDDYEMSDDILENLKRIDDIARTHGEEVISRQIVTVEEYIDAETLTKYESVIKTQTDIQNNFKDNYNQILASDEFIIPQNIANGLIFVAYVFGMSWDGLGEYAFILVFSATIGVIALLIGFGVQKNNIEDRKSSRKPSNKKKGD